MGAPQGPLQPSENKTALFARWLPGSTHALGDSAASARPLVAIFGRSRNRSLPRGSRTGWLQAGICKPNPEAHLSWWSRLVLSSRSFLGLGL